MKFFFYFLLIVLIGCNPAKNPLGDGASSVQQGYGDPVTPSTPVVVLPKTAGVISGSRYKTFTNDGYRVGVSVGNPTDKIQVRTNDGYRVFISVEGQLSAR